MKYGCHIARQVIIGVALACAGCSGARAPAANTAAPAEGAEPGALRAPPAQGAFSSGAYRNLFTELGLPQSEVEQKVVAAYRQLFHGAPDDAAVMFEAGQNERGPLAYIRDIGNDDVRSEGMSYGMMIAVQMNEKRDFDALWNWAKTFMQVSRKDHPVFGYFAWKMRADGTVADELPAPDGEEYFATALAFAAHRWGNGSGIYDYQQQAAELLSNVKNRQPITGKVNGNRETTVVALFHPEHKMVRFSPDTANFAKNGDHTDPSYHLPAFYELWALWGPDADRAFWADAARASREHFVRATHPQTALSPDYSNFDGTPKAASWDENTVNFRYDAWRTAMNWSVDCAWWAKDSREVELSNRLLKFFAQQGQNYGSNFELAGTPTNPDHSPGLVATNAVAALCSSEPVAGGFVQALYSQEPPTGKWRYYDGLLHMMALLHVSGQFRVHAP